ncbi:MAG: tight adherence protein [Thermoleophilaceae bacterium]|jgi:tight adherence protein B|nr:tight adherence protein [Thermoleophilaceae bacterium]
MSAALLAFAAAALAVAALAELARSLRPALPGRLAGAASIADSVLRLGREGRDPGAAERRRLLAAGAACALAAGWFVAGPLPGVALACAGPWLVARLLRAMRERYRRAVDAGAAGIALSLADALGGGHSLRGALAEAAAGLGGAAGQELRRVANELVLGARTEAALEAMRVRVRSHGVDTIVAACLLQRRSGGDLARLLRDCARSLEDQERLLRDARAATAQARFTGGIVVALPLAGAALAELAQPGYLRSLTGSFLTAWLAGLALAMQVAATVLIRRLGRVKA